MSKFIGLNDAEKTALAKVSKGKLDEGSYHVDAVFHVIADIMKSADYEKASTVSIPLKKALALFVRYCGVTRESAVEALTRAMKDSLEGVEADFGVIDLAEKRVERMIGELPKTKCSGPTRIDNLIVEKLAR